LNVTVPPTSALPEVYHVEVT